MRRNYLKGRDGDRINAVLANFPTGSLGLAAFPEQPHKADDGIIHYDLRLDRDTFAALQELSRQYGTAGIGGMVRHLAKKAIDRARHAKRADVLGTNKPAN
jgi:hypothetical protein